MKRSMFGILPFLIFLFAVISCENPQEENKDVISPIYFQVSVTNNTDSQVDIRIMPVYFGSTGYDEKIYINEEEYNRKFLSVYPLYPTITECLLDEGYEEYVSESNIYFHKDKNIYKQISGRDKWENVDFQVYEDSMLIEIKFADGKISRLVGWPKYFNDKLENVKKFGFFYDVWPDKKAHLYRENENNKELIGYFFDESENIAGGYMRGSVYNYPMEVVINSADDIKIEVSEIKFSLEGNSDKKTLIVK